MYRSHTSRVDNKKSHIILTQIDYIQCSVKKITEKRVKIKRLQNQEILILSYIMDIDDLTNEYSNRLMI